MLLNSLHVATHKTGKSRCMSGRKLNHSHNECILRLYLNIVQLALLSACSVCLQLCVNNKIKASKHPVTIFGYCSRLEINITRFISTTLITRLFNQESKDIPGYCS